jgi:hypothetical protein
MKSTFLFIATWAVLATLAARDSFAAEQFNAIEVSGLGAFRGKSVTVLLVNATATTFGGELPNAIAAVMGRGEGSQVSDSGTASVPAFDYAPVLAIRAALGQVERAPNYALVLVHAPGRRAFVNNRSGNCPQVPTDLAEVNVGCAQGVYGFEEIKTFPIDQARSGRISW